MLSDDIRPPHPVMHSLRSQCPLEHCMLSDNIIAVDRDGATKLRLNALSSIVCFLTYNFLQKVKSRIFGVSMPSRALYAF